jgi:hypothetical protein
MTLLAHGELLVLETDDGQVHLGTVEVRPDALVVRSGFAGRPTLLDPETVERICPAAEYLEAADAS